MRKKSILSENFKNIISERVTDDQNISKYIWNHRQYIGYEKLTIDAIDESNTNNDFWRIYDCSVQIICSSKKQHGSRSIVSRYFIFSSLRIISSHFWKFLSFNIHDTTMLLFYLRIPICWLDLGIFIWLRKNLFLKLLKDFYLIFSIEIWSSKFQNVINLSLTGRCKSWRTSIWLCRKTFSTCAMFINRVVVLADT